MHCAEKNAEITSLHDQIAAKETRNEFLLGKINHINEASVVLLLNTIWTLTSEPANCTNLGNNESLFQYLLNQLQLLRSVPVLKPIVGIIINLFCMPHIRGNSAGVFSKQSTIPLC
jgi:hypothetical protein